MLPPEAGLRSIPEGLFDIRLFLITTLSGPFGSRASATALPSTNAQFSKIRVPLPVNLRVPRPLLVPKRVRPFILSVSFAPPLEMAPRAPWGQKTSVVWLPIVRPALVFDKLMALRHMARPLPDPRSAFAIA